MFLRAKRCNCSEIFQQLSEVYGESAMSRQAIEKCSCRWVTRLLTEENKGKRFESVFAFLQRYQNDGNEFWNTTMTGDETLIHHFSPETKRSSIGGWKHSTSPTRTKCQTSICGKGDDDKVFFQSRCGAHRVHDEMCHN
ncbi:mariner Mos1 transposase [Nephila pilipes]|uniref:Mariner Mos1 transposase n=1 Tax=Nephila pilipes TaxID=299642 RepID=A0A8X6T973_NEPPI|nr:mariner Mos1 transposase [Nephila pilipes]